MDTAQLLAFQAWREASDEGLLVLDATGTICLTNPRLLTLFKLDGVPATADEFLAQFEKTVPEMRAALRPAILPSRTQWGNLRPQRHSPKRLTWQQIPLKQNDQFAGLLIIFRDATAQGQLDLARQSFLSMISHDLRTPLSTILGFGELLYYNRGRLSDEEQKEFLEHIIKNANELTRYTQIVLDILFLEANLQEFQFESVVLERFVTHWLSDAVHRLPAEHITYRQPVDRPDIPQALIAPAALHKILNILVEFALAESPPDDSVQINVQYNHQQAHVIIQHKAPSLAASDTQMLFELMYPRDLSEAGRPPLHRMQMYVANLLAERQQGYLTLRQYDRHVYQIDLALPLTAPLQV